MAQTARVMPLPSQATAENLSALVDGELLADRINAVSDGLFQSDQCRLNWYTYHLVGDVLRTGESLSRPNDAVLLARIAGQLAAEASCVQAQNAIDSIAETPYSTRIESRFDTEKLAANDARFSWQLVSGMASLMVVVWLGWQMGVPWADHARDAQLAGARQVPSPLAQPPVPVVGATLLRDPQLDAALKVNRPSLAVHAPPAQAGLVRSTNFQGAGR